MKFHFNKITSIQIYKIVYFYDYIITGFSKKPLLDRLFVNCNKKRKYIIFKILINARKTLRTFNCFYKFIF